MGYASQLRSVASAYGLSYIGLGMAYTVDPKYAVQVKAYLGNYMHEITVEN